MTDKELVYDDHMHQDGFRIITSNNDGLECVEAVYFANGYRRDDLEQPCEILLDGPAKPGVEPIDDPRNGLLLDIIGLSCIYLNIGGDMACLQRAVARLSKLSPSVPLYDLIAYEGIDAVGMVWRKPDGSYLHVVDGHCGFVDCYETKYDLCNALACEVQ